MAARTIPFPPPPGIAATQKVFPPPPPPSPSGAAKLITASRRYRGLQVVSRDKLLKASQHLDRIAQTEAIVAQVEREVAEQARRSRNRTELLVLEQAKSPTPSFPTRLAHRVVLSLFSAGI